MGFLKSYFTPAKVAEEKKSNNATLATPGLEMAMGPVSPSIRSGFPSRPASLYPEGDFRNSPRESMLDIKTDVMASYIQQQQLEKLWSTESPGEGVILKKEKGSYACCPPDLQHDRGGLFDAVVQMNVRVCSFHHLLLSMLITFAIGCPYSQHSSDQALLVKTQCRFRSTRQRSPSSGPSLHRLPPTMPETSLCCFHSRQSDVGRLG